jgi:prepilin-type N-terminal cleavage/methylation domain-containing protein
MGTSTQEGDRRAAESRGGFTLIEMAVVVGLLTIVIGLSASLFASVRESQRAKGAAREVADLLNLARAEAIRTGNRHIVYFGNPGTTDPSGNPFLFDGQWVPVLLIDDGPPDTSDCRIDAGEAVDAIVPAPLLGISWGVAAASAAVPTDSGGAPFDPASWDGGTFDDPTNAKTNGIMFRPDGVPVTFTGAVGSCGTVGNVGTGGGGLYVTDGARDFAVVLTPLGGVRLHVWAAGAGAWSG